MLIDLLRNDESIIRYICDECQENGIGINISNEVDKENLLIIKIDNYYNHLVKDPDCSPDCLIIQRCGKNIFSICIVELRNVKNSQGFKISEITKKFNTCLSDFMGIKFGNYFHNRLFDIKKIDLVFISDPYGFKRKPNKQVYMRGHKLDMLMAQRIPKYFNKHLYIKHHIPNPTLNKC